MRKIKAHELKPNNVGRYTPTEELAYILYHDLTYDNLKRYLAETDRMITNETKYGRSTTVHRFRKKAAELALSFHK